MWCTPAETAMRWSSGKLVRKLRLIWQIGAMKCWHRRLFILLTILLFLPPSLRCKSWMKVYLFVLRRAEWLINILIYLDLMILKVTMHLKKRITVHIITLLSPCHILSIYTVHISYIRPSLFSIFSAVFICSCCSSWGFLCVWVS